MVRAEFPAHFATSSDYVFLGSGLRIAIVHARWNATIVDALVAGAKKSLLSAGVAEENITIQSVPGSYELPFAVQRLVHCVELSFGLIASIIRLLLIISLFFFFLLGSTLLPMFRLLQVLRLGTLVQPTSFRRQPRI